MNTNIQNWLDTMVQARTTLGPFKPEGWKYCCIEDYVSNNGVAFTSEPLTEDESQVVFDAIDASRMRFQIKECFYNAQLLVLNDSSDQLIYHEGYGYSGIFPVLHGWATINNKVIDLTWRVTPFKRRRMQDRVLGEFPQPYEYFGVPFANKTSLRLIVLQRGAAGTLIDDWENHWPLLRGETFEDIVACTM